MNQLYRCYCVLDRYSNCECILHICSLSLLFYSVEDEGEAWGGVSGGGVEPVAEDLGEDLLNLGAEGQ